MNYVHLKPVTRAAETSPTVDVDLFEDRGVPVSIDNLEGRGFALEGFNLKEKVEGTMIWIPGLNFDEISARISEKEARSTSMDDPDEDGL